jgi:hypothetical protein
MLRMKCLVTKQRLESICCEVGCCGGQLIYRHPCAKEMADGRREFFKPTSHSLVVLCVAFIVNIDIFRPIVPTKLDHENYSIDLREL